MNPDETTIAIMGQQVPARHERIPINQLHFLPDNPRVYAAIREMTDFNGLTADEKQIRIYERLLQEPSVKNLIPEIRRDKGLQDPITVRHDTWQVIEGNSRLAAYRKLAEESGDEQWTEIRCLVVTSLTDDQQTRLLGQAHLHGKTDWSPYAKALFCFRWVVEEKREATSLSNLSGISSAEIKKNVRIVQLMQANGDDKLSHFSYYSVLVRSRPISAAIAASPKLEQTLLAQIKTQPEPFTAQEMRERLPTVIAKPRILRKYEKGDVSMEDAFDRAKISGAEQRLKKVRDGLDDIERDDLAPLERHEVKSIQQVVRQIRQRVKRVSDMVDAELLAKSPKGNST
ncbi:MAG: ParB N-terminal domain-containing protein [Gammaproteobacteria bacterium]|nr:ParB N-terminal domain-containing protein [Gammaproteobacteria bacterium]